MSKENANDKLEKWLEYFNNLSELKCNYCGVIFKGGHECDYKMLKKKVYEQQREIESLGNTLQETNAYYIDIDKKIEKLEGVIIKLGDKWVDQQYIIMRYEEALRKIDNHIRATSQPVPYIIKTLKKTLPEYE